MRKSNESRKATCFRSGSRRTRGKFYNVHVFHTERLEDGQCHNRDPIMENLDNRISVNRDVIPPGSISIGNPECVRAAWKIYSREKRAISIT